MYALCTCGLPKRVRAKAHGKLPAFSIEKYSARNDAERLKEPNIDCVVVFEPDFSTPRIVMHIWVHSTTTATPCGFKMHSIAFAICVVSRS